MKTGLYHSATRFLAAGLGILSISVASALGGELKELATFPASGADTELWMFVRNSQTIDIQTPDPSNPREIHGVQTLTVCPANDVTAPGCADPYAGALIGVKPDGRLKVHLRFDETDPAPAAMSAMKHAQAVPGSSDAAGTTSMTGMARPDPMAEESSRSANSASRAATDFNSEIMGTPSQVRMSAGQEAEAAHPLPVPVPEPSPVRQNAGAPSLADSGDGAGHCMAFSRWNADSGWVSTLNLANLHMHGFLVQPDARRDAAGNLVYGDNIFVCGRKQTDYDIAMNGSGEPHPSGVNWIHPHIHGIAKAQVSAGMAQMVVIDAAADLRTAELPGGSSLPARNLLLKDIQTVRTPDNGGHFVNFADQDPDFCGDGKTSLENIGHCALPAERKSSPATGGEDMRLKVKLAANGEETPLDTSEGAWIFTVNGQEYPDITVAPGASEVWRVQNASANITYRLRLSDISSAGRTSLGNLKFAVLQMDGATPVHLDANGGTGGSDTLAAPQTEEILLMPGSRAELGIVSPQPEADLTYQLVAGPFQAGFTKDSADTWPRIALARVHFEANPPTAAPARAAPAGAALVASGQSTPARAARAAEAPLDERLAGVFRIQPQAMPQRETLRRNQSRIATFQAPVRQTAPGASRYAPTYEASPATFCSDLAGLERWSLEQKAHPDQEIVRRIYFGIQETADGEFFLLGETFLNEATGDEWNGKGQTIDYSGSRPAVPVTLSTFDPAAGPCAYKVDSPDAAETWELVNVSPEVHNFHIHQLKYRVRRDPKSGALFYRAPSPLDAVEIPASLAINTQTVDLQHDTIIVPRGTDSCSDIFTEIEPVAHEEGAVHRFRLDPKGKPCRGDGSAGDESGMIQLDMAFAGGQFASFPDPADPARLDPATFVFHCHILEHEDNGMMQRISVIDPKIADPGAAQSRVR